MVNSILPTHIDNSYKGYKIALWIFGLVVLVKLFISLNAIFNGYSMAGTGDSMPLDAISSDGVRAVVALYGIWGLAQLVLTALCILALFQYRAVVAFMFVVLIVEYLLRRLLLVFVPIPAVGTPPGSIVNAVVLLLMIIGLGLSLRGRANAADQISD